MYTALSYFCIFRLIPPLNPRLQQYLRVLRTTKQSNHQLTGVARPPNLHAKIRTKTTGKGIALDPIPTSHPPDPGMARRRRGGRRPKRPGRRKIGRRRGRKGRRRGRRGTRRQNALKALRHLRNRHLFRAASTH